jgi:GNAT superfamily N-acetyltransferase
VLWEARGRIGEYDRDHPDETRSNHFPKVLYLDGVPIGVIRIDFVDGSAWFRRVAIAERYQRNGHGRELIRRSEQFALDCGVRRIESSVDGDAIGFYRKLGYQSRDYDETSMYKAL